MAEVTLLRGYGPVVGSPPQDVIELCEDLLSRARRGEIKGFAFAGIDSGGSVIWKWAGGVASVSELLAAIARLQHKYQLSIDEQCRTIPLPEPA